MKNNNTTLLVVGLVLAGVIGYSVFAKMQKSEADTKMMEKDATVMVKEDDKAMMEDDSDGMMKKEDDAAMMEDKSETMMKDDSAMMESKGGYLVYAGEDLMTKDDGKRVLFFYANWCPTCKPVDAAFSKADLPADLTVIRVNYNDAETDAAEKALAEKYGVTYQHTFVQIDQNGKLIKKWNGGSVEDVIKNVQ